MLLRRVGKLLKAARTDHQRGIANLINKTKPLSSTSSNRAPPAITSSRVPQEARPAQGPHGPPSRWLAVEKVNDAPTHPGYRWQPQSQVSLSRYEATRSDRDDHSLILFPDAEARWPTAKACLSSLRTLGLHVLFFQQRSGAYIVFTVCQRERRSDYIWPLN